MIDFSKRHRKLWMRLSVLALAAVAYTARADTAVSPAPAETAHLSPAALAAAKTGVIAMAKNNFAAAETSFLTLLKLAPDNINGLVNLGMVEFRLGRAEEAEKYLERAIRVKPDVAMAWMILGVIDANQDDLEASTAALAQAAYLNPRSPQVHNYFAVTLSKRGWFSAAEDELQRAIRLDPNFAEAHFNLAVTYLRNNPPAVELARRHYQRALDLGAAPDPQIAAKLAAAPVQNTIP